MDSPQQGWNAVTGSPQPTKGPSEQDWARMKPRIIYLYLFADADPQSRKIRPVISDPGSSLLLPIPGLYPDAPQSRKVSEHVVPGRSSSLIIPLPWAAKFPDPPWAALLSLGIFPHADVVCVFIEDCGGLKGTEELLRTWAELAPTSQYHPDVRPHLIMVSADLPMGIGEVHPELLQPFSGCSMISLPKSTSSSSARHNVLKIEFERAVRSARDQRRRSSMLFSTRHLETLFLRTMKHLSQPTIIPFNVVQASRQDNPVSLDYGLHLTHFMTIAKHQKIPHEAQRSFIASAMLLDAYPPDMHSK
jgi:hypothetical protein